MINSRPKAGEFSFEYFERTPAPNQKILAQEFLQNKYPKGTATASIMDELRNAGAKCEQGFFQGRYYKRCTYDRPGHGLMRLVSTINWIVVVITDESYNIIEDIVVNRGATGM